jgi:hypothetical protein
MENLIDKQINRSTYYKEYYQKNREYKQLQAQEYYYKNKHEVLAKKKIYCEKNKEKIKEYKKIYHEKQKQIKANKQQYTQELKKIQKREREQKRKQEQMQIWLENRKKHMLNEINKPKNKEKKYFIQDSISKRPLFKNNLYKLMQDYC